MKNTLFIAIILFAFGCNKNNTTVTSEPAKILSAKFWKLDRFTDADGKTLSQNQLNSQAQALFGLDFEFRNDNVTRAKDRVTKQILNAGTWYLLEENKTLNIDIIGFQGKFKVVEISQNKLTLQAENNQMISVGALVNMEFLPAL